MLPLLEHAAAALEEAETWTTLAASARHFQQQPEQAWQAARVVAAAWSEQPREPQTPR